MTAPKRRPGRPPTPSSAHHSESVEVRLTPALRASLEAAAAAARLTLSDLCRARLGATGEDGALRAAFSSGWRACAREAAARAEALGREVPVPEVVT